MFDKCRNKINNSPFGDGCHISLTWDETCDIPAVLSAILQNLMEELKKPWLMEVGTRRTLAPYP